MYLVHDNDVTVSESVWDIAEKDYIEQYELILGNIYILK